MENLTFVQHKDISLEAKIGKKTGLEVLLKVRANSPEELSGRLLDLNDSLPTHLAVLKQKLEALEVKKDGEQRNLGLESP